MKKFAGGSRYQARIYPKGTGENLLATLLAEPNQLEITIEGQANPVLVPLDECDMKVGGNDDRIVFDWRTTGDTIITDLGALDSLSATGAVPAHVKKDLAKARAAKTGRLVQRVVLSCIVGVFVLMFAACCILSLAEAGSHHHGTVTESTDSTSTGTASDSSTSTEKNTGTSDSSSKDDSENGK